MDKNLNKKNINYSWLNVDFLKLNLNDIGNILPRRITKLTSKKQRKVSKLIKIARNFLLV